MGNYGAGLYGVGFYATPVSAVVQATWPPRVLVTVIGLTTTYAAISVTVEREVAGERVDLRGAIGVDPAGNDAIVRTDAELPFGVPVRYVATIVAVSSELVVSSAPVTAVIEKVALSDAISGLASQVVVLAWPDKAHARQSTVYQVGGRTVVVSGQRSGFNGLIDVLIESDAAREAFEDLLAGATSGVVQIRQEGAYGGVDSYVAVHGDAEHRFSQDGSDQRRRWSLDAVQVDGWPSALEARGFTLEDLHEAFDIRLDELDDEFPGTLLDIAQADLS